MRTLLSAVVLTMGLNASAANAAAVDWKFYGGADIPSTGKVICFYEEGGITKPKPGIVDVWAKCIPQIALDNVPKNATYSRAYIDMSASRLAHYYRPPILNDQRMNIDQIVKAIVYESLADVGDFTPEAQFYYELDCRKRMVRELTMTFGNQSKDTPSNWGYVPPEGNAATLLSLLCH